MLLQQHDNSEYIGWELRFPCAQPCIMEELQTISSQMETDLECWKQEVEYQWSQFYELNYFTSQQLLLLREELGRLNNSDAETVKPEAIALLQSISREVCHQAVRSHVLNRTTMLVRECVPVDINHPVVKNLLKLDYSLEQCLQAAEQYPNDVYAAHFFLQQSEEQGVLFREALEDEPVMDWTSEDAPSHSRLHDRSVDSGDLEKQSSQGSIVR